jgi:hypothetical protein
MAPGTRVVYANPTPRTHTASGRDTARIVFSYHPLESALRGGIVLRLLRPGVRCLGVVDTIPLAWADAEVFLYRPDGTARHVGHGSRAEAELGSLTLRLEQWARAERMFLRSLALGDTLPDAILGLGITRSMQGDGARSRRYAEEFLRRWPGERRAPAVRKALHGTGAGDR